MIECKFCGTPIPSGTVCPECHQEQNTGAVAAPESNAPTPAPENEGSGEENVLTPKQPEKLTLSETIIGLVLLAAIVVGAFFLLKAIFIGSYKRPVKNFYSAAEKFDIDDMLDQCLPSDVKDAFKKEAEDTIGKKYDMKWKELCKELKKSAVKSDYKVTFVNKEEMSEDDRQMVEEAYNSTVSILNDDGYKCDKVEVKKGYKVTITVEEKNDLGKNSYTGDIYVVKLKGHIKWFFAPHQFDKNFPLYPFNIIDM